MSLLHRSRIRSVQVSKLRAGLECLESRMLLSGVTGYNFPAVALPVGIASDNAGNLYISDNTTIDKVTVDAAGNPISAVAFDAHGPADGYIVFNPANSHLYYNDNQGNIDEMDTNGNFINSFAIPSSDSHSPGVLTVASDGAIWFAAQDDTFSSGAFTSSVVRMDLTGHFTEQDIGPANTTAFGIAAAPDGSVWVGVDGAESGPDPADVGDSSLVHATFSGGTISATDYAIPQPKGLIAGLTVAPDGSVWYDNDRVAESPDPRPSDLYDQIGHATLSGGTLSVTTYAVPETADEATGPTPDQPAAMRLDSSGRLWFTETGHISYLDTTSGQFTRMATGDTGAVSLDLAVTAKGAYMTTIQGSYTIEAVTFAPVVQTTSTTITSSASTAVYGQQVTFTAAVVNTGGSSIPTGTVQFLVDGSAFGAPVSLDATGQASFAGSFVSGVSHTIAAVYSPSSNFLGSSASMTQVLQPLALETDPTNSALTDLFIGSSGVLTGDSVQVNAAGSSNNGSTGITVITTLNGVKTQTTYNQALGAIYINLQNGNNNIQLAPSLTLNAVITAGNGGNNFHLANGNYAIMLGNGNNNIQTGSGSQMVIAGNGNNNVSLGSGSNDVVILGSGNDNVTIGTGNGEYVQVGTGNDNIHLGNGSNDTVVLGAGSDNVQIGNGSNNTVILPLGILPHNIKMGIGFNNIIM